jgi:NAD(P)-dependent dehydrogenase (short-subunit alcohol dehydrogenase family)
MNVFITGSNGAIGKSIKSTLESEGVNVISYSSKEMDLSSYFNVSNIPVLDGFIHAAGINLLSPHDSLNDSDLLKIFNVNVFSFVNLCSRLEFNSGANIIAIGSFYSESVKENRIQYSMSKHALLAAVKTIALEKAKNLIKVNLVSPGFVDTALTRKNNSESRIKDLQSNIPLGLTEPIHIANMCSYLINKNHGITGQNMLIDSGYSLKHL